MTPKYMKYYKAASQDVVGVVPGHQSEGYTFLPNRTPPWTWIRTEDLHDSPEEAVKATVARFY